MSMAEISQNEIGKIIRDLLRIAKVAMPSDLYDQDPRVVTAIAAVRMIEAGVSPSRPPNVSSRAPSIDVAQLATMRPVEMSAAGLSFVLDLPWDLVDPLVKAQDDFARLDPADTVQFGLRDWLTAHGYLVAAPSDGPD